MGKARHVVDLARARVAWVRGEHHETSYRDRCSDRVGPGRRSGGAGGHRDAVRRRNDLGRHPEPRLRRRRLECDRRRLRGLVLRDGRHDVRRHHDPVGGVRRHGRRLRRWLAAVPDPRPDTLGREERLRVPRARAVVLGVLAERVDRLGQPDRIRRCPVRHEPGPAGDAGIDLRAGTHASSGRARSPGSRSSSTRDGRSPTRSKRCACATSR